MKTLHSLLAIAVAAFMAVAEKAHAAVFGFMSSQGLIVGLNTFSDTYLGKYPVRLTPVDAEINEMPIPFKFPDVAPSVNDLLAICKVPAGVEIVDFSVIPEDCDSNASPTIVFSVGSLNVGGGTMTTTYKAGCTGAGTGTIERGTTSAQWSESNATERVIGLQFTTAAATYVPGKRGLLVLRLRG